MKYKISGKKIKEDLKKFGFQEDKCMWADELDGEIVDFKENKRYTVINGYLISKDWCEPIEESSKINTDKLIEEITEFCKHKIKIIDEMEDTIVTDSDIGRAYAYHKILDIIEREVNTND